MLWTVLRCRNEDGTICGHIRITSDQRDKLNPYNTYTVVQWGLTDGQSRSLLRELNKHHNSDD